MKVKELIEKLKSFDPNALVVVGGFDEEGYADLKRIEMVEIVARESQTSIDVLGEYRSPDRDEKNISHALLIDHD